MKQIDNIYSISKELVAITESLRPEIQSLKVLKDQPPTNETIVKLSSTIDRIKSLMSSIDISMWMPDHFYVTDKLGITKLLGKDGEKHFNHLKSLIQGNSQLRTRNIKIIIDELLPILDKPQKFIEILESFDPEFNIEPLNENEGIIEIIFDNKAGIDDFKKAKEQMNDWFLIIEGYARILNVTREDFEIISISKNSPTKFKVKTGLKNATLILSVMSALVVLQKEILEKEILVKKLEQIELDDKDARESQKTFIKTLIEANQKTTDEKVQEIVQEKLKEQQITDHDGDIKNSFAKSVHTQNIFISNGGDINVYLLDENAQTMVKKINAIKDEIKLLEATESNSKLLKNEDNVDTESQSDEITQ